MSEHDDSWADLFEDPSPSKADDREYAGESTEPLTSLDFFKRMEGVAGVIRVTEDGVVQEHSIQGDTSLSGSVTATTGVSALQIERTIHLGQFQYAVATIGEGGMPFMILSDQDTFIGLLLGENISPAHVASKLNLSGKK